MSKNGWTRSVSENGYVIYSRPAPATVRIVDTRRPHPTRYHIIYKPGHTTTLIEGVEHVTIYDGWITVAAVSQRARAFELAEKVRENK